MFAGALLSTGARLAWDPSTYAWMRWLCSQQYRASLGYVVAAGLWLLALCGLSVRCVSGAGPVRRVTLLVHAGGVLALVVSELAFAGWLAASLAAWWRDDPRAEMARAGVRALEDLRPALLAVRHYREQARAALEALDEVQREAPNNAVAALVLGALSAALQALSVLLAVRLARVPPPPAPAGDPEESRELDRPPSPPSPTPAHWKKRVNLRMYTVLDKIF